MVVFATTVQHPDATPFLSVDVDGSLLLAMASPKRYALARVRPQKSALSGKPGALAVTRIQGQHGHLVRRPIVDRNGYSFVVEGDDGRTRVDRLTELHAIDCGADESALDQSAAPAGSPGKSKGASSSHSAAASSPAGNGSFPCDEQALAKLF